MATLEIAVIVGVAGVNLKENVVVPPGVIYSMVLSLFVSIVVNTIDLHDNTTWTNNALLLKVAGTPLNHLTCIL